MATIFICYRRHAASGHAGRLYDHLSANFGKDEIFFDTSSIPPGIQWDVELERQLTGCKVLLAVISRSWVVDIQRTTTDYVIQEIATALRRAMVVIPVLVDGAELPSPKDLPQEIEGLAYQQATSLSHTNNEAYVADVGQLASVIRDAITESPDLEHGPLYFTKRINLIFNAEDVEEGRIPASAEVLPTSRDDLGIFGLITRREDGRLWSWGEIEAEILQHYDPDWVGELATNVRRACNRRFFRPSNRIFHSDYDNRLYLPILNSLSVLPDGRTMIELLFVEIPESVDLRGI